MKRKLEKYCFKGRSRERVTVEELSELYYINKEIKSYQLELAQLKQMNFYKKNIISSMPCGGEVKQIDLEYASNVLMLEDIISYGLKKLQYKRKQIEYFINSVEDAELRAIMRLRAINNMKWEDIGKELNMDRRTVSRKFYSYFEDCPQCDM